MHHQMAEEAQLEAERFATEATEEEGRRQEDARQRGINRAALEETADEVDAARHHEVEAKRIASDAEDKAEKLRKKQVLAREKANMEAVALQNVLRTAESKIRRRKHTRKAQLLADRETDTSPGPVFASGYSMDAHSLGVSIRFADDRDDDEAEIIGSAEEHAQICGLKLACPVVIGTPHLYKFKETVRLTVPLKGPFKVEQVFKKFFVDRPWVPLPKSEFRQDNPSECQVTVDELASFIVLAPKTPHVLVVVTSQGRLLHGHQVACVRVIVCYVSWFVMCVPGWDFRQGQLLYPKHGHPVACVHGHKSVSVSAVSFCPLSKTSPCAKQIIIVTRHYHSLHVWLTDGLGPS